MRHWQRAFVALGIALVGAGSSPAIAHPHAPVLSLLEPAGSGCRWVRFDPATRVSRTIATFAHDTDGATMVWSPKGDRAIVWFKTGTDTPAVVTEVTIADGKQQPLPLPPIPKGGSISRMTFDDTGTPIALTMHEPPLQHDKKGDFMRDLGHRYAVPAGQDGIPGIAHAYAFRSGHWILLQSTYTTTGWDYGQDVDALPIAAKLAPDSTQLIQYHIGSEVQNHATLARLHAFAPTLSSDDGEWHQAADGAHPAFVWEESGEFLESTGRLAVLSPSGLKAPQGVGIDPTSQASYAVREPYLLVAAADGSRTCLLDLRGPSVVYASNNAVAACFWP
ncbi:MAG TPA: hypothetical protein V6D47_13610 [Oscillatoriaceae cyanobacterium]